MTSGSEGAYSPTFGMLAQMREYYQAGAVLDETQYVISTNCVEQLTGADSEYVITLKNDTGIFLMMVIPRENRLDADVSDKAITVKVTDEYSYNEEPMTQVYIGAGGTFNLMNVNSGALSRVNESNPYRESYYLTNPSACNLENDFYFDYYLNSGGGGGEDECPSGGSHNFSAIGQPAYTLPNYQCPSCGKTGYCAQHYTKCTNCGAISEFVRCQNCGWQSG